MGNIRAFLKAKKPRTTTCRLSVVEDDVLDAAEREFHEAQRAVTRASLGTDEQRQAEVQERLEQARAALAECVYEVRFHNLPAHEFEALIGAHKPTKEQQEKGSQWNADTFAAALIAACVADSDLTAEEWAEELRSEQWSLADINAMFAAALDANYSSRSATIPKG